MLFYIVCVIALMLFIIKKSREAHRRAIIMDIYLEMANKGRNNYIKEHTSNEEEP